VSFSRIEAVRNDCALALEGQTASLSQLRGETVVITGGSGFVGAWLAESIACLNDQHSFGIKAVLISRQMDKFRSLYPHLGNRGDFSFINSDVRDVNELPKDTGFLIHAAANPSSRFHSSNPVETMSIISEGTSRLLRAVERSSLFKMFLYLSSASVYGAQPQDMHKIQESYVGAPASGSIFSAYSEAKRYAETLCAATRSQSRIPSVVVRPFTFLGPYQSIDAPWAVNNFIKDAIAGGPIQIFGDGQTVRSYMYGADCAFWLLKILTAGVSGTSYNVGGSQEISLQDLATIVSNQFTARPEIRLRTLQDGHQRSRLVPDVSLAQSKLGLSEKFSLKNAIERTIHWNQ
jgi:nucleoside-diphosphate-sugar epimerase